MVSKKEIGFSYSNSLIEQKQLLELEPQLRKEIAHMNLATHQHYEDERAAINLPVDGYAKKQVKMLASLLQKNNPSYLVVVGIGGSNTGTMAIQQLLQGKLHNERVRSTKVLYADTVDSDEISEIREIIEGALQRKEKVAIVAISKSGTTPETIANFEILLETLKKYNAPYTENVVCITDVNSPLYELAEKNNVHTFIIPSKVGGRYSVLSPVGLFPLALLGVDIDKLLEGAKTMRTHCLKSLRKNPAALSAGIRYLHATRAKTIQDMFLFGNDCKSLGKWYRQLFAESLGKGCNREDRQCIGITPTYSIGSTDMHSIAQLYLGGPFDKFTTFVKIERNRNDIAVPNYPAYNALVPNIQKKSLQEIMDAIYQGVIYSFKEGERPFTEITLPDKSEYSIGQFIQFEIMEVMYLAALLNVNPFDQPDIESYKEETRRILSKK